MNAITWRVAFGAGLASALRPKFAILFRMKKNRSLLRSQSANATAAALVAVARYRADAQRIPHFSGNEHINDSTNDWTRVAPPGQRVWITISLGQRKKHDAHLRDSQIEESKFSGLIIIARVKR